MLIEKLCGIPTEATSAVIDGVEMQIIDVAHAGKLLDSDPEDKRIHESVQANGRFLFKSEGGTLKALYKVL